jgi:hypothetical protein
MAAFCACCGAEIGLKAEACPVCGTPQHGMVPAERSLLVPDGITSPFTRSTEVDTSHIDTLNE